MPSVVPGLVRLISPSLAAPPELAVSAGDDLCQAEVEHLGLSAFGYENVGGLNVAVDDAFRLRGIERVGHFDADSENRLQGQGHAADAALEADALQQFHCDEGMPVRFVDVVNGANVGMVERGRGLRLAPETLEHGRVASESLGQELEGDKAAKFGILGAEDHAHAAAAKFFQHAIVGDDAADRELVFCHALRILVPHGIHVNPRIEQATVILYIGRVPKPR